MVLDEVRQSRFYQVVGFRVLRAVGRVVLFLLGPLRVVGARNVPRKGGLLILANHLADCDPPIVQISCPRATHFMGKSELFEMRFLRWVLPKVGAFPVKRGEPDRPALRHGMRLLSAGEALAVFPEGEISETGEPLPLKPGVALLARSTGVPVICCGLRNTQRIIPYGSLVPRPAFGFVWARWGEARTFDRETSAEQIMEWVGAELRRLSSG